MKVAILVTFSFILMCVMHETDAQGKFGARKQMQAKGKYKKVIGTKPIIASSSRSRGLPKTLARTNKVTRTRPVQRVVPVHRIAPGKPVKHVEPVEHVEHVKHVEPVQHVEPNEHVAPTQSVAPGSKIVAVANAVVAVAPLANQVVGAVLQSRRNGNYLPMQPQMQNQFSQHSMDSLQNSPEHLPEDPPQDLPQDPPQDSQQDPPQDLPQESQDSQDSPQDSQDYPDS